MPNDEMGSRALPQPPDVAFRKVLLVVFGFLAFVGTGMAGLFLYLHLRVSGGLQAVTTPFPEPTLQINPQGDLDRFEAEQTKQITGTDWVDRGRGLARIPIEDAMRIVAGRGDKAYEPAEGPAVTPLPGSRGGVRP